MTWCRAGDKPLPEPMMTQLTDTKIYLPASVTYHMDELVQERCNSSALAMEIHLSCTNPSISCFFHLQIFSIVKNKRVLISIRSLRGYFYLSRFAKPSQNLECFVMVSASELHLLFSNIQLPFFTFMYVSKHVIFGLHSLLYCM